MVFKKYRLTLLLTLLCLNALSVFGQANNERAIQYIDSVSSFSFQFITSNPSQAQTSLQEALTIADSLGYQEGMARVLEKLSLASSYLGEWEESVEQRIESIRLFEELGLMLEAGYGFAELGWGVRRRSLERADYFMKQGIEILVDYPQSVELSNAYNNYGILKLDQQKVDSAIFFIEKSLDIKESNRDTLGIAYSYGYLGSAYQELEDFDRAIEYLERSFELKTIMRDSSGMAIDLTNIAANYNLRGNIPEAADNFRKSLQMALQVDYKHLAEHNYNSLANLYEQNAQYDSALHYQKLFTEIKDSRIDESTNQRLAELEVQFETEEKEKELALQRAELASTQLKIRNRNWTLATLGSLLLFGGIITFMSIRQQKIKQRENSLKLKLAKAETQNRIHQERERISRDLHDNVGAQITSLISGLEISNFYVEKNKTEDAISLIKTLDSNARDAMNELRETIWLLNKSEISMTDFIVHLEKYVDKHRSTYGNLEIIINHSVEKDLTLDQQQSLNLLRIIQEALSNCVKYAQASQFNISINQRGDKIELKLFDNGIGATDVTTPSSVLSGNGLLNMKRRTKELNGEFKIDSKGQSGFFIDIRFPLASDSVQELNSL